MKIKKKTMIIISLILALTILNFNYVDAAALQSNTNNPVKKTRDTWMTEVRKMEGLNGTLGLEETQNSNLTPSTESGSNNLDVHMQKNTEYGAMAILSASNYGKIDKVESGQTTTGNKTGVFINGSNEWVSANQGVMSNIDSRYYNNYIDESKNCGLIGDATFETEGWHGSTTDYSTYSPPLWGSGGYFCYYLVRMTGSGLFSYSNRSHGRLHQNQNWAYYTAYSGGSNATRAVIVNGQEIN